ncbi:MAG: zinc ribbon domain-containing protein, partial [Puniceicoccaceae bacterium]
MKASFKPIILASWMAASPSGNGKKASLSRGFAIAIFVEAGIHCQRMVAEWLQKLLILQDRDSRCDGIQRQLDAIPGEISAEESNISKLQEKLAALETEARDLEVRRLDLEGEVEQTEAAIVKYKTQQMQVKKNEEYTALENEIKAL